MDSIDESERFSNDSPDTTLPEVSESALNLPVETETMSRSWSGTLWAFGKRAQEQCGRQQPKKQRSGAENRARASQQALKKVATLPSQRGLSEFLNPMGIGASPVSIDDFTLSTVSERSSQPNGSPMVVELAYPVEEDAPPTASNLGSEVAEQSDEVSYHTNPELFGSKTEEEPVKEPGPNFRRPQVGLDFHFVSTIHPIQPREDLPFSVHGTYYYDKGCTEQRRWLSYDISSKRFYCAICMCFAVMANSFSTGHLVDVSGRSSHLAALSQMPLPQLILY